MLCRSTTALPRASCPTQFNSAERDHRRSSKAMKRYSFRHSNLFDQAEPEWQPHRERQAPRQTMRGWGYARRVLRPDVDAPPRVWPTSSRLEGPRLGVLLPGLSIISANALPPLHHHVSSAEASGFLPRMGSVPPLNANPTTRRTGRAGQDFARATHDVASDAVSPVVSRIRRFGVIYILPGSPTGPYDKYRFAASRLARRRQRCSRGVRSGHCAQ